jgi:hypothetical protein
MADLPEYNHFSELEVVPGPNRPQGDLQVVPVPLSTPVESWPPYHESKVNAERERSLWKRYRLWIVLLLILIVLIVVGGTVGGVLGGKKGEPHIIPRASRTNVQPRSMQQHEIITIEESRLSAPF